MWSPDETSSGSARAPLALAPLLLLAMTLGGCASSGEKAAGTSLWDRTVQNVSAAYESTKAAISSTVRQITKEQNEGWGEQQRREREKEAGQAPAKPEAPAARASQAPSADRFPAGRLASREPDPGKPDQPPASDAQDRGIVLLPRIPQTPERIRARMNEIDGALTQEKDPAARRRLTAERARLASALQASLEEESLILEMERLRTRLRRLQGRLNEIQRGRP